jgi:type IV pilus assembly protein PilB
MNPFFIYTKEGLITEKIAEELSFKLAKDYNNNPSEALLAVSVPEQKILDVSSKYYGIPFAIKKTNEVPNDVMSFITESSSKTYKIIPIGMKDKVLEIGLADPSINGVQDAIRFIFESKSIPYKLYIISPKLYIDLFSRYSGVGGVSENLIRDNQDDELKTVEIEDTSPVNVSETMEDAPMRRALNTIIRDAIRIGASDIHIENTGEVIRVRYRLDGILETKSTLPKSSAGPLLALVKLNARLLLDEHRKPQDGGYSVIYDNRKVDLRISTLPSYFGEKIVIRILDIAKGVFRLDDVGLLPDHLNQIRSALKRPYGMILITGPTGSGKSTTLYAMLSELDREKQNIVSLEDPVEYHVDGITQSQVHPAIGYTFAAGLRSILRQDPDVIMVGEIRDRETAELAIQAALTGHLVLATLHTNTAVGAIPRLVDMGIDPYLIAPTLILSVAQRLTRSFAAPNSKIEAPLPDGLRENFEASIKDLPESIKSKMLIPSNVFEPKPTPDFPTGLKGRLPVFEMFEIDKDVQHLMLNDPKEDVIYKLVREKGMRTMKEDAYLKSFAGKIPLAEVYSL